MNVHVPIVTSVILAALLPACGGRPSSLIADDLLAALQDADRLERNHAFALARAKLAAIAATTDDPQLRDTVSLRLCAMWALQQNDDASRRCYKESLKTLATDEARALASHRGAMIALEQDNREIARNELFTVVTTWPQTDAAGNAMRSLGAMRRQEMGEMAQADALLGVASAVAARSLGAPAVLDLYLEAMLGAGRICLTHDKSQKAADILGRAYERAAATTWHDDIAIWRARALGALGQHRKALDLYETVIDGRESSWFIGSYESAHFDDALFERAETLAAVGDVDAAHAAYLEVIERAPTSRLVDDAAFAAAKLAADRGDRRPAQRFVDAYPDSRHVAAARALLEPTQ